MLEELGVPYELKPVDIGKGEQFEPAFLKISPNNRMPAIVDPDGPGGKPISVFESGAILQYLGRKIGRFYPAGRARPGRRWRNGCSGRWGGWAPWPARPTISSTMRQEDLPYAKKRYTDEVHRLFGVMNKRLATPQIPGRRLFHRRHGLLGLGAVGDPNTRRWTNSPTWRPGRTGWARARRSSAARRWRRNCASRMTDEERKILFGQRAR